MPEPRAPGRQATRPGFRGNGRLQTGGLTAPRARSGGAVTKGKPALVYDRNILLSEKFRAARPFGVAYKVPIREFSDANASLAAELVDDIIAVLESRLAAGRRPQRSTEALIHAIRAEENRDHNAQGFTVGIEAFLDSTPAGPYYRNLEYGSNVFVGRVVEGFFLGPGGKFTGPVEGARDALRLIQVGSFTNPAEPAGNTIPARKSERTGKIIPERTNQPGAGRFESALPGESASARVQGTFPIRGQEQRQGTLLRRGGARGFGGGRENAARITIRNPIPEYAYFRDGTRRFLRRASGPEGLIARNYAIAARDFTDRGGLIIK